MRSIDHAFADHSTVLGATVRACAGAIERAAHLLTAVSGAGGTIFICGNGGSAADAQHFAAELVVRYVRDRQPIAALALTTDSSTLTACANDLGYELVFSRQLLALGSAHDALVAISTSGGSQNVLRAIDAARHLGMPVIGLSGAKGFRVPVDIDIQIPSRITARIQEMHILVIHILCQILEGETDGSC